MNMRVLPVDDLFWGYFEVYLGSVLVAKRFLWNSLVSVMYNTSLLVLSIGWEFIK